MTTVRGHPSEDGTRRFESLQNWCQGSMNKCGHPAIHFLLACLNMRKAHEFGPGWNGIITISLMTMFQSYSMEDVPAISGLITVFDHLGYVGMHPPIMVHPAMWESTRMTFPPMLLETWYCRTPTADISQ